MKDVDITQVFCEVLTGLAFFLVFLSIPVLVGSYSVQDLAQGIFSRLTVANLGAALAIAYLVGSVMDAVGLAIDDVFLFRIVLPKSGLTEEERARFWTSVSSHVLAYREVQWAYYSCYRNLFLLFVLGGILWTAVVWCKWSVAWGVLTAVGFCLLLLALLKTMRVLVNIYFTITKSHSSTPNVSTNSQTKRSLR